VLNQNCGEEEEVADQNFDDYVNFELPMVTLNKNIRKRNKMYKKEFIKFTQTLLDQENKEKFDDDMTATITTTISKATTNELLVKLNEISDHFQAYHTQKFPKMMLNQLNMDIHLLYNYSEGHSQEIIESNVLLTLLDTCLKTVDSKWIFPLK